MLVHQARYLSSLRAKRATNENNENNESRKPSSSSSTTSNRIATQYVFFVVKLQFDLNFFLDAVRRRVCHQQHVLASNHRQISLFITKIHFEIMKKMILMMILLVKLDNFLFFFKNEINFSKKTVKISLLLLSS